MASFEDGMDMAIELAAKGVFDTTLYEKKCKEAGVDLHHLKGKEDFERIPFLYKDEIRNTSPYERTNTRPEDVFAIFSSSGTTGKKTYYIFNQNDCRMHEKFVRSFYTPLGLKPGGLGAVLAPIGTGNMAHMMTRQFTEMGMGVTWCPEPTPENIVETVTGLPVTCLATLPEVTMSLDQRGDFAEAARTSKVQQLILGGSFLSEKKRRHIEELWNAKVYNSYGLSEIFGPIANECPEQNGLHYHREDLLIELFDPKTGRRVEEGQPGVAVYTTLWQKGFPILRYWSKDLLQMVPGRCSCGSDLPRFQYFGRLDDCYQNPKGDWVSPTMVEEAVFDSGLRHYQVVLSTEDPTHGSFLFEEGEQEPGDERITALEELFQAKLHVNAVPQEALFLRGFKPKLILVKD